MAVQLDVDPSHVAYSTALLLQLPIELLDLIASYVAIHRDLVSLALTCQTLTHIVVPAHTAYRTIRIHSRRGPAPWAIIAARPVRAAGVRCLVLFDQSEEEHFLPERAPVSATSFAPVKLRRADQAGAWKLHRRGWDARTLEAAASAVRAMPNLDRLVFSGSLRCCRVPQYRAAEMKFWAAVAGTCGSLKHLEYTQPPHDVLTPPPRSITDVHPLWSVSNLTSLIVTHAAFLRHLPSVVQFSRVLRNSPALQNLTLAVHDSSFDLHTLLHDVRFSHLQTLAFDILAPDVPSNARVLSALLERTPTLQHVAWKHLDPDALSTSALPSLRTLHVEDVPRSPSAAACALLRSGTAALEALGSVCVDVAMLRSLEHMHGEALRRFEVASFESIAVLVSSVRLFPRLRWLRLPAVDYWHEHSPVTPVPVHLGEWVEVLAALPELEVFRGVSIFRDPESSTTIEENDERACDVLRLCPRLRQVEHWDLDPAHVVALAREGDRVVWRVEEVPMADGGTAWSTMWKSHLRDI